MIAAPLKQQEQSMNYKALAWTVGIHALLLLLFFFLAYTVKPPVVVNDGGGLEVNLGTSDNGSGTDQPMSTKKPAQYQATVVYKSVTAEAKSSIPQNILQSNQADAPAVDNTRKKDVIPEAKKEAPVKKEVPKYAYQGETGQGGNSASQNAAGKGEGITTGPGDQGVPGGTPGAANYSGTPGNGTGGIGHTLTGRDISPDKFEAEFKESGKVVIHVTVDKNGNIIDRRVKSSSSPQLAKIAMDKLSNAKFTRTEGPEPQQFGDVTIIFKTRQ